MKNRRLPLIAAVAALAVPAAVLAQQPTYEVPPAPPPEPASGAEPPLEPLEPEPALRRAVVIQRVRGRVAFQLPGETRRRRLTSRPTAVPMQTVVDAEEGRVRLTVERDTRGRRSKGVFYGGRFRIAQGAGRRPITHLRMVGEFDTSCGAARAATATAKKRRRRLWGDGKGRFRTRGYYSAATVRGTKWLVEDRCEGTLTRVVRGEVEVVDFSDEAVADPGPETDSGAGEPPAAGAPAPTQGGGSAPARRTKPRKVRVRNGGSYVAGP